MGDCTDISDISDADDINDTDADMSVYPCPQTKPPPQTTTITPPPNEQGRANRDHAGLSYNRGEQGTDTQKVGTEM